MECFIDNDNFPIVETGLFRMETIFGVAITLVPLFITIVGCKFRCDGKEAMLFDIS